MNDHYNNPQLIINLDINKTLMFGDLCKQESLESSVLALCAESSWGKISTDGQWSLENNSFSFKQPNPHLISYGTYLKQLYPKKKIIEIPDKDKRVQYNQTIKTKIGSIIDNFVLPGNPGHSLHKHFEAIMGHLTIPSNVMKDISINPNYHDIFKQIYKKKNYHLLLSLFFLMIKLMQQNRDFALVFRSFGQDIKNVMIEFNEFCKGNHPVFDGKNNFPKVKFDGTEGSKNFLLSYEQIGVVYRSSDKIEDITVVMGTLERKKGLTQNFFSEYNEDILSKKIKIINGGMQVYHYFLSNFKCNVRSFALSDSYFIWFENEERSLFGKPLLLDPYDKSIHQIFFDDNINQSDTFSIVDCRNIITGKQILIKDSWNKYIVQVDTLSAVIDYNYFFKCIEVAEDLRRKERKDEEKDVMLENKQLKDNIYSLIDEALMAFSLERESEDLGEFISRYVMVYKDKINYKNKSQNTIISNEPYIAFANR